VAILPRVRSLAMTTSSLRLLAELADNTLVTRLRTDEASKRTTSWVRILCKRFLRGIIRKSGLAAAFQLLSGILLAVPPDRNPAWRDGPQHNLDAFPDVDEYLRTVLSRLPPEADEATLERIALKIRADGYQAGLTWFNAVARRAEQWRQESSGRDGCEIEMLGEVIWGVYEDAIGPRPLQFELFDQLRLQLPDLLQGLSVHDVNVDGDTLVLLIRGIPSAFHDLTFTVGRRQTGEDLVLEATDGRSWRFERLEAGNEDDVHVVFRETS
jgi:hypothetical protein